MAGDIRIDEKYTVIDEGGFYCVKYRPTISQEIAHKNWLVAFPPIGACIYQLVVI